MMEAVRPRAGEKGSALSRERATSRQRSIWKTLAKYKYLYLLGIPGLLNILIFHWVPIPGIIIAFQKFSVAKGLFGSPWVGLANFERLFASPDVWIYVRNTLTLSFLSIIFLFPAPIVLALLLNEVRNQFFKRSLQTVYYLPHFLSMVIVVSLTYFFLSAEVGLVNKLIVALGGTKKAFLFDPNLFYPLILFQNFWKEVGWGTIIYLAAIAGVNPELYEAAMVDGAGKFQRIIHITIPSIMPTVVVLLVLSMGGILSSNLEQMWLMQNPLNIDVSEVIDTYIYKAGVRAGDFSYTAAVGLTKSLVALALVIFANWTARKAGQEGLW